MGKSDGCYIYEIRLFYTGKVLLLIHIFWHGHWYISSPLFYNLLNTNLKKNIILYYRAWRMQPSHHVT